MNQMKQNFDFDNFNQMNLNNFHNKKKVINQISLKLVSEYNRIRFKENKDPKKNLSLIDSSQRYYNIYIPIYFNKQELYQFSSDVLSLEIIALIYHNNILEYDDSSIDDIEEGGELFILYKGESYKDYLNECFSSQQKIIIKVTGNVNITLSLPKVISVSQMIKAIALECKIFPNKRDYQPYSVYSGIYRFNFDDERTIKDTFKADSTTLQFITYGNNLGGPSGPITKVTIFDRKKGIAKEILYSKYSSLNGLFREIENNFEFQIKNVYIGKFKIKKNDEKSLASINAKDKIFCDIEFDSIYIYLI